MALLLWPELGDSQVKTTPSWRNRRGEGLEVVPGLLGLREEGLGWKRTLTATSAEQSTFTNETEALPVRSSFGMVDEPPCKRDRA